jgi:ribosomal protein L34
MKKLLLIITLFSVKAQAQRLSLLDLVKITESRKDTGFVFRYIRQHGFNVRGRTDDGNVVLMGDRDKTKKSYTEMVFVNLSGDEVKMFQYGTRQVDVYAGMRRQLAEDGSFNALPTKEERGEIIETFSSREYLVAIQTVGTPAHYVISIRAKPTPRR